MWHIPMQIGVHNSFSLDFWDYQRLVTLQLNGARWLTIGPVLAGCISQEDRNGGSIARVFRAVVQGAELGRNLPVMTELSSSVSSGY